MNKQDLLFFALMLLPVIIVVCILALLWVLNKDEFVADQAKRAALEIKEAKPYNGIIDDNGNRCVPKNLKPLSTKQIVFYTLYFFIAIVIIKLKFGVVSYGPNLPYIIFLVATGVPFLIGFAHAILNADKQRNRLIASGLSQKDATSYFFKWLFISPLYMLFLIKIISMLTNEWAGK